MQHRHLNILIVTSTYPPEIRSMSHLMQELAEELAVRDHRVRVATTYPSMNLAGDVGPDEYPEISTENSVEILRIKTPIHPHAKGNFIQRGLSQLILPYVYFPRVNKWLEEPPDAVIVYSPPLTLGIVGGKIKRRYGANFLFNVQDIFPQNAIDLGILKNPVLIAFFEYLEKRAYHHADIITVHSEGNAQLLAGRRRFPSEKLTVLHNWIDIPESSNPPNSNRFRKELNLENKFIFFFGGVLGPAQGLDLIVRAAKHLRKYEDMVFLLVGDGLEKVNLQNLVRRYDLTNVMFYPFVSKHDYRQLLTEIDVGLVCLTPKNKTPVVPGKLLSYMAASVPVAAFLHKESDGHQVVRDSGCGISEISDDADKAAGALLHLYTHRDENAAYGINGLNYAKHHFSKNACVDQIVDLLT